MKRLENDVEKMLVKACSSIGIKCKKGKSKDDVGYPDRVVYHTIKHRIFHVEVKNETYYQQQVPQSEWQKRIVNSGGEYFLIDGEKEMKKFIEDYIL